MLSDVEKHNNLMLTSLAPVATLVVAMQTNLADLKCGRLLDISISMF